MNNNTGQDTGSADTSAQGTQNAPPQAPAGPTPGGWVAALREITTTGIAAVVVLVSMFLLWAAFEDASDENFERKKDVMLYALPILGSVIGYYFGRVPAERRAEAAEHGQEQAQGVAARATEVANAASQEKQAAADKLSRAKATVEHIKERLQPAAAQRKTLSGGQAGADELLDAYAELEVLSRQL